MKKFASASIAVLFAAASAVSAATYSDNFNARTPGQVTGGADTRMPGGSDFYTPDNAATFGEYRAGVGLGGTGGLVIGNRGNANDGVIDNVKSPRLSQSAGETGTNSGLNGTNAGANKSYTAEYSFRTASASAPVSGNLRFRSEVYGNDRTTFFGLNGASDGSLTAFAVGIDPAFDVDGPSEGFPTTSIASGLTYGAWYRLVTTINFVDGGTANDVVSYQLFDATNTLVGSATTNTWEEGARQYGYNGGAVPAVDALQFHSRGGFTGDNVFVDNISYSSAVPEPTTLAVFGLGLLGLLRRRVIR